MAQVQAIMPYHVPDTREKVAAYCRVSSDSEDQLNSYFAQITYYTQLISEKPDWELVDIYADEGITGTSMEKRDAFNRMLEDCRQGKINRILVKSVTRFARNFIEQLEATRELTDLGVVVQFEEQNIDTSNMLSEMQLTLHGLAAENESRAISQNMRWSYKYRMESGRFSGCYAPFGYCYVDKKLVPHPDEFKTVILIFDLALRGMGRHSIIKELDRQGIKARNGHWTDSAIRYILNNEKYIGDCLLQKKYTTETFPFEKRINHGERPKYYVEGDHRALITKEAFQDIAALQERRRKQISKKVTHLFTGRIVCPDCHRVLRQTWSSGKSYWVCAYQTNGRSNCTPYRLPEDGLVSGYLNLAGKLFLYKDQLFAKPLALLGELRFGRKAGQKLYELEKELVTCKDRALALQKLLNKGFISEAEYRSENEKIATIRKKVSEERHRKLGEDKVGKTIVSIQDLREELETWEEIPAEFDIDQFDRIVEKIIPGENGTIKFLLRCGLTYTEVLP